MSEISPALENYLESILIIQNKKGLVRVTDLAQFTDVKAPSVIEAVSNLKKKGLVIHERYGHIELTGKGLSIARKLYAKHTMLKKFFHEVLGLDEDKAEADACTVEHYLSKEALHTMLMFTEFVHTPESNASDLLQKFFEFARIRKSIVPEAGSSAQEPDVPAEITLKDLEVGQAAVIRRINDTTSLKRRLLDMGFVKGEQVRIERRSPFGFPVDVLVKGAHISLRKDEAEKIIVEL
ncbi:MAG: metal-dependent transcriptional regulator [Candidatus Auribacterota bacterium]